VIEKAVPKKISCSGAENIVLRSRAIGAQGQKIGSGVENCNFVDKKKLCSSAKTFCARKQKIL
jgi:hypothetical protein